MEYNKKIMPNPLNINGNINNNYKNENFATSDMDGETSSNVYRTVNNTNDNDPIIVMKRIPNEMYLPGLGELGIAIQNITYINDRITYINECKNSNYADTFDIHSTYKYMSGTLYYDNNINNENYINNASINNIWAIDLSEAYVTYSSIQDKHNIMPMYKYIPDESSVIEETYTYVIDPTPVIPPTPPTPEPDNDDDRYSDPSYFCSNLDYYFNSYIYNYRSSDSLSKISSLTYFKFGYIPSYLAHEVWQIQHTQNSVTFNWIGEGATEINTNSSGSGDYTSSITITEDGPNKEDDGTNYPYMTRKYTMVYKIKNNSNKDLNVTVKYEYTEDGKGIHTYPTETYKIPANSSKTGKSYSWDIHWDDRYGSQNYTGGIHYGYLTAQVISASIATSSAGVNNRMYKYPIDFCFILPNFNFKLAGKYIYVGTTKETNLLLNKPSIDIYDTKIIVEFNGLGVNAEFYPKSKSENSLDGCIIFETSDKIFLESNKLKNNTNRQLVSFTMYYYDNGDYWEMFKKSYYFDIYDLYSSGASDLQFSDQVTIQFLKVNNHKTNKENNYITFNNLPTKPISIYKNNGKLNLTYYINTNKISNEYPGLRVNNLESRFLNSYSYSKLTYTYGNMETGFGITYISGFYNNGLGNTRDDEYPKTSYYYRNYADNDYYRGNMDVKFNTHVSGSSNWCLRTFNNQDEFGIYNDCILNMLVDWHLESPTEVNKPNYYNLYNSDVIMADQSFRTNTEIQGTSTSHKIYNLPICGSKQYIFYSLPNWHKKYYSFMSTKYLFIVNTLATDITITFEDETEMLCRNKVNLTIKSGEMKLYYPILSDIVYNIKLKNITSGISLGFNVYDMYDQVDINNGKIPGDYDIDKLLNTTCVLYNLYEKQNELKEYFTTTNYFNNILYKWTGTIMHRSGNIKYNDCTLTFERPGSNYSRVYFIEITN